MRLIVTALVCVLAAFGAAFLVGRATSHQGSATAATVTRVQPAVAGRAGSVTTTNAALAAQFEPGLSPLKRLHHRRHRAHRVHRAPAGVTPAAPTQVQTTPVSPSPQAPVYSAPSSGGSSGSGGSGSTSAGGTHHKSGGSGTTTIGG